MPSSVYIVCSMSDDVASTIAIPEASDSLNSWDYYLWYLQTMVEQQLMIYCFVSKENCSRRTSQSSKSIKYANYAHSVVRLTDFV